VSDTGSSGQQVFNGRYEVQSRIARGGMADVFLARDTLLDRPVALKVLFPEFATDPSFVERFRREAQSAANLNHPNIVSVLDYGEASGTYFIVMEYVEGRSLAQIIRDEGGLSPDRAADITIDIASALGFAHRNGVIHRDVKPGNVLINTNGQVKVTDFGIARAVSTQENLTQTGTVMGTATYFSPEQARGEAVDPRSDVYALGVVLYESLAGRPPFSGDNPVAVAYKHVQEPPPPPRQLNPAIPEPLEAITLRAMAKNPANRYASADDLAADLRRFRNGQAVEAEPLLPPPTTAVRQTGDATRAVTTVGAATTVGEAVVTPPPGPQRNSGMFIAVLIGLLLVLAGLIFLLARTLGLGESSAEQVAVPDVIGRTQPEAVTILQAEGFRVKTETGENDQAAENTVFDQDPDAGTKVDEGSEITIVVASAAAPVEVPNLIGQMDVDADSQLRALGLVADFEREDDPDVPAGTVIDQDPEAGEPLPPGSAVRLTVSNGPGSAEVPDVVGMSAAEAANRLGQAGFTVVEQTEASDEPEGTVLRTDPPAGTDHDRSEPVTVVVSTGEPATIDVPDVRGLTESEARAQLSSAGFSNVVVQAQLVTDEDDVGRVISQSPGGGAQAAPEDTITITVGRAPLAEETTTTTTSSSTTTTTEP